MPSENVSAGTVIVRGSLIGITKTDIPAGRLGAVHLTGVFDIEKINAAIPVGGKVYWGAAAGKAVINATGNLQIGIVVADAAAEDTLVRVKIG